MSYFHKFLLRLLSFLPVFVVATESPVANGAQASIYALRASCSQDSYLTSQKRCRTALKVSGIMQRDAGEVDLNWTQLVINYAQDGGRQIELVPDLEKGEVKYQTNALDEAIRWRKVNDVEIPLEFSCDFNEGTRMQAGEVEFSHPQLRGVLVAKFAVQCVPLTEDQKDAQRRAEQDKARAQEKARAEERLKASPEYKAREAAKQIRAAQLMITDASKALFNEQAIGRASGYVDMARLHDAGERIVFFQNMQLEQWKIYKANGGKAQSINDLLEHEK